MTTARPSTVPVLTDVLQVHADEHVSTGPMVESALAPQQDRVGGAQGATAGAAGAAASPFVPYNPAPRPVSNSTVSAADMANLAAAGSGTPTPAAPSALDEGAIVARVLDDLQRQIDLALEHQLTRALEPALQRLTQAMAVEAREAVGVALRDLVQRAVKLELDRVRAADTVSGSMTL
jgi:hypothetical protein